MQTMGMVVEKVIVVWFTLFKVIGHCLAPLEKTRVERCTVKEKRFVPLYSHRVHYCFLRGTDKTSEGCRVFLMGKPKSHNV